MDKKGNKNLLVYALKIIIYCCLLCVFIEQLNLTATNISSIINEKLFAAVLICVVMAVGICKFEKIVQQYKNSFEKRSLLWAMALSLFTFIALDPLCIDNVMVDDFDRVIGLGVVTGIDISKIITNFTHTFFFILVSFVLSVLLVNYFRKQIADTDDKLCLAFLDTLFDVLSVNLLLNILFFFLKTQLNVEVLNYSFVMLCILAIAHVIYILLKLKRVVCFRSYQQILCVIIGLCFPIVIVFWKGDLLNGYISSVIAILGIFVLLLSIMKPKVSIGINVRKAIILFSGSTFLLTSLYVEVVHILNQNAIFVRYPLRLYIIILAISFLFICVFLMKINKEFDCKKVLYPVIVFGISCLSIQLPLQSVMGADIFEKANSSILVSDFLLYDKLPIVEHYGGHMLVDVLNGIVYGWLNNDYTGAIFSPYSQIIIPVVCIILFGILKKVLDDDYALFTVLFLPYFNECLYFGLGLISCFSVIKFIKNSSYKNALLIWICCGINALYRLDLGLAFDVAVILVLLFYCIMKRDRKVAMRLSVTFTAVIILVGIIWCTLCIANSINPIERLLEFLMISLSNKNWAYGTLGDVSKIAFTWGYLLVPFCMIIALSYIVLSPKFRYNMGIERLIILVILGLSYFINFSRGCVRHNLNELQLGVVLWTANLFFAIFLMCLFNKKIVFLLTYMILLIMNSLLLQNDNVKTEFLVDNALNKATSVLQTWWQVESDQLSVWEKIYMEERKVERIIISDDMKNQIEPIEKVFEVILEEEETYMDFVNRSFMYSVLNRKDPVYVAQSPGHLSGEYTQEQFISQIEEQKEQIPIVMMPTKQMVSGINIELDQIANVTRYYKVAEYIYQNYRPLCIVNDIALWCDVDRYGELYDELKEDEEICNVISFVDWGYDAAEIELIDGQIRTQYYSQLHNYNLFDLPYLWANYDEKKAKDNDVIIETTKISENIYKLELLDYIEKKNGNYISLHAKSSIETNNNLNAQIAFGRYENGVFDEKYVCNFTLKNGSNQYLIRMSIDYYWYLNEINAVRITSDVELEDIEMVVLEGD